MRSPEPKQRRARLVESLAEAGLDALFVSSPPNIRYLSGFTGSSALLLAVPGRSVLFTDPRYAIQSAEECDCRVRVVKRTLITALAAAARRLGLRRIGFEQQHLTCDLWQSLRNNLAAGVDLVPASGLVEELRAVKSPAEVALIRQSARTCRAAFQRAVRRIRPGLTEAALAAEIDHQMRRLGAEGPAFETIVAAGPNAVLPHARPGSRPLRNNELLLIDMGARQDGYASDMTRVLSLGEAPAEARQLHAAVLEAQLAALQTVRDGVAASAVDRRAREVLRGHGLDKAFTHSTGHGLGLEIHEAPRIGQRAGERLRDGMVITVEPGVYIKGFGGVRIEDTVLVTQEGCEILTPAPKDLLMV